MRRTACLRPLGRPEGMDKIGRLPARLASGPGMHLLAETYIVRLEIAFLAKRGIGHLSAGAYVALERISQE